MLQINEINNIQKYNAQIYSHDTELKFTLNILFELTYNS